MLNLKEASGILERLAAVPSVETCICVLQNCRKRKDLEYAKHFHAHICDQGLEAHRAVENYFVPVYVECGSLSDAQQVFNTLAQRNEHSWASLILGYVESGQFDHAFNLYKKMQDDCVEPSSFTLVPLLRACACVKDVKRGREMHAEISQQGLETDLFVGSTLVGMYGKCGSIVEAQEVFNKLSVCNVVSWNALLTGYAEHGPGHEGLNYFEQMLLEGLSPDSVTFVCVLKTCGSIGAIDKGQNIHKEITQKGLERHSYIGNTLVGMYAKCGSLAKAREVFDKLLVRDVVSWTALIAGYAEHGHSEEALTCFDQMQLEYVNPNSVTFACLLKACCGTGAIERGRDIHSDISQKGLETEISVGSTLVDMYAKHGSISEAEEIFTKLPARDVVSWNALIAGYVERGPCQEALNWFEDMQLEGVSPSPVTMVWVLKACGNTGAVSKGREIHTNIAENGFDRDLAVDSTLVYMYSKCGSLLEAQEIFAKLSNREVVSWTAIIAGYAEHGPAQEALKCFEEMQLEHVFPDAGTFVCLLKSCGNMGAIDRGIEIHSEVIQKGYDKELFVVSALVDMYAKCGSLLEAWKIFEKLSAHDVVSWSSLIGGYAVNHEYKLAAQCFERMQQQGVKPNAITFTCLLTACSHASLVFQGWEYFNLMREEYGIIPTADHYTCMVDLLARSGCLHEAEKFVEAMPCPLSEETWKALLSSCKTYGDTTIGLRCFHQLVQMNPQEAASYVLMADIYASAGRSDDACGIEDLRKFTGAKKKAAVALMELNQKVHEFNVGENHSPEILTMLDIIRIRMKEQGHVPHLDLAF